VGGVSGEPMRATSEEWEQSCDSLRCSSRNGGRHPDSRDAVSLRGWTVELESWSVRLVCKGLVPGRSTHRRQRVSSGRMRRGTLSACAKRTHSSRWRLTSGSPNEDTSFARSRDPCTSIVTLTLHAKGESPSVERWRGRFGIAVGKTCASRRNRHRDRNERTQARLAARHRFSRLRKPTREGRA
jgi:hypothetical protein